MYFSIRYSKKRPQQDSNLRTRLRRPLPYRPLTCRNTHTEGFLGAHRGRAMPSGLVGLAFEEGEPPTIRFLEALAVQVHPVSCAWPA